MHHVLRVRLTLNQHSYLQIVLEQTGQQNVGVRICSLWYSTVCYIIHKKILINLVTIQIYLDFVDLHCLKW